MIKIKKPEWLPDLVLFEDFGGDWSKYVDVLYKFFEKDFILDKAYIQNIPVNLLKGKSYERKECAFWHIISEGSEEEKRQPDLRRCERIRWPRPIIEHSIDEKILVWENIRGSDIRTLLWFEEFEYIVILIKRKRYFLLLTAYPVFEEHQKVKFKKDYIKYKKADAVL